MKVDLTHPETNVAMLEIHADSEQVSQTRQAVYRKLVGKYSIPGFRRGKAPRAILESFVGSTFFDQEVLEELISELYPQALKQTAIEPVAAPEFDLQQWEPRESLTFTAKVTTKPVVTLGQYTGHEIPKTTVLISDEEIDQELQSLRQAFSQLVEAPAEEPLSNGSVAVIDFTGYVDGEPFEGGAAQDYPLELGSGSFIPGFEDALLGAKIGDERDVDVTFPEQYAEALAGKAAVFKVTVKAHRRREMPELSDELAAKAAPMMGIKPEDGEFDLAALRAQIKVRLEVTTQRKAREEYEERVLAKVAGLAEIEVPRVLIEGAAEARLRDYEQMFQRSGSSLEQYLAERELTEEGLRASLEPAALETVRRELVLDKVAALESIAASDQEVDERIATYAQMRNEDQVEVRARLVADDGFERIRDEIVRRKTIDFLVGAQIEVPAAEADEPIADAVTDDTIEAPLSVQVSEAHNTPEPDTTDAAEATESKPEAS